MQKKKRAMKNKGLPKKGINLPGLSIKNGNNGLNINIGTPPGGKPGGPGGIKQLLSQLLGKGKGPKQPAPGTPGKGMPGPAFMKGLKTGFAMANKMNGTHPHHGHGRGRGPGMGFVNGFKAGFGVGQQMCGQQPMPGQIPGGCGQMPGSMPGGMPGLNIGINLGGIAPTPTPPPANNINMLGIGLIGPQFQANPIQFNQNFGGLNYNTQNTGFAF